MMWITTLIQLGSRVEYDAPTQRKIQLSNAIALIIGFGIATPFVFFSYFFFPPLVHIPIVGVLVCLGIIAFNAAGAFQIGRFVVATLPLLLALIYEAYLAKAGEEPVTGIHMISLSFTLVPFIIYDLREKAPLIATTVFSLLLLSAFSTLNAWLEIDLDTEIIRTGFLGTLSSVLALLVGLAIVLTLALINRKAENKADALYQAMEQRNEELLSSQNELEKNIQLLHHSAQEEKQRTWATEGMARFAHLLREQHDLKTLGDRLIAELVPYLGANQGGFYSLEKDEEGAYLALQSCYAYNRKKYLEQRIEIGEGLLGQTFLEKMPTYLTEVPADYINITSGLGEALPRALLIMPLMHDDQVEGLIEVASFREFPPHVMQFLHSLGESLAVALRNQRINTQTARLLSEATLRTQQLQEQEEEMRQNMEELAATQEEMQRKEEEFLKHIATLEAQLAQKAEPELVLEY
ncbi:GAF domain-containing protein [Catalinimonas alkaloidigena]|uniref:GAF domain-containing protein n=1 Tax=Catalinimonas alkaloidigena TaxID=1075417 RepID=A0A1G9T1L4_9BACT|nr:GAF domain-containing protein [Catalinimonas alkaloidigena]SDM40965.1 GAF domain-containing protein [Catalinimonas alkaloidigena]